VAAERDGTKCWIAARDVTPGAVYADAIVHALDASSPVIPTTSREIAASAE
jgi:hypothetical protein